jgi:hypothetical protein
VSEIFLILTIWSLFAFPNFKHLLQLINRKARKFTTTVTSTQFTIYDKTKQLVFSQSPSSCMECKLCNIVNSVNSVFVWFVSVVAVHKCTTENSDNVRRNISKSSRFTHVICHEVSLLYIVIKQLLKTGNKTTINIE